ncbi:MAG: hypothetical protein ACYS1C_09655, partial [Planctomycetota bacterium]
MKLRTHLLLAFTFLLAITVGATHLLVSVRARRALVEESKKNAVTIAEILSDTGEFSIQTMYRAEDLVGSQMIVQATLAAHLVDIAENGAVPPLSPDQIRARLRDIAAQTVLDEFWITDEKGHAYLRNVEEIHFTFPSTAGTRSQAHEFWPLLSAERGQV